MSRGFILLLALLVVACGGMDPAAQKNNATLHYSVGEAGGRGKHLIPYTTLSGFMSIGNDNPTVRFLTGVEGRQPLVRRPIAVGAGDDGVFVVDAENHSLYRFRWPVVANPDAPEGENGAAKAEFVRIRALYGITDPNDLFIGPKGDLFLSDGKGKKVVQYGLDGKVKQVFKDEENLNLPVSVTADSRGLRIFVADGLYDRIIVFGPQGLPLYGIGGRGDGPGNFRNIRGMVQARNGLLYVVNGVQQQVQAYGLDGMYMGSFGQGTVSSPEGIAVDDEDRLYIADRLNHRIVIYRDGKMVEQYGRYGIRPGEFNQPSRLAYHNGMLYVVDTENGRVQVFKVVPQSLLNP